jgi:hypothetical protein
MCEDAAIPWKATKLGGTIAALATEGAVEVWTSPVNVLEIFLCADFDEQNRVTDTPKLDLRVRLAQALVELTDCRRMAPGFEFLLVRNLLQVLDVAAPAAIRCLDYFEFARTTSQQVYAGLLAMLAALRLLDRPEAIDNLLRSKITSRLLHSRFARDPAALVDEMVACAKEFRVTTDDIWAEFDARPLQDLREEIDQNTVQATPMDNATRGRLQKNKRAVAEAYSAAELGQCMASVFHCDSFLLMTFDTATIRDHWGVIHGNEAMEPPKFLAEATPAQCASDASVLANALQILFRDLARTCLLYARVPDEVVLGELEMCLAKGEIPTGGLSFDCEHAAMLSTMDIFLTHDTRLLNLAKRAAKFLSEAGGWHVEVVANEKQLQAAAKA